MKTKKKVTKKPEAFKSLAEAQAAVRAHNARAKKFNKDTTLLLDRLNTSSVAFANLADTVDTGETDDWMEPFDNED